MRPLFTWAKARLLSIPILRILSYTHVATMARLMKWNPQRKIFREQVTYPRIKLTPENPEDDSCQNPSMPYEHVLQCGHLVITKKPDEQCAENCHHINELRKKGRDVQNSKKKWSTRTFYCDACEEAWIEKRIPLHISSTDAGKFPIATPNYSYKY
jgi:hypothetical protein